MLNSDHLGDVAPSCWCNKVAPIEFHHNPPACRGAANLCLHHFELEKVWPDTRFKDTWLPTTCTLLAEELAYFGVLCVLST